jgi:hypothetical protein
MVCARTTCRSEAKFSTQSTRPSDCETKVVLILSKHSIENDWVEDEVKAAFEEERKRKQTVLFPIRLDNQVRKHRLAMSAGCGKLCAVIRAGACRG